MQNTKVTVQELAQKITGAMPALGSSERQLVVRLYHLLAEGEPVSLRRLAKAVNLPETRVREILGQWPGVFYDGDGSVIGFWGLALGEMPHRFEVDGRTLYAWCAWDSLFIPELLGTPARVTSADPVTKDQMTHQFLNRRLEVEFEQAPLQSVARHVDAVAAGDAKKAGRQYMKGIARRGRAMRL